MTHYMLL